MADEKKPKKPLATIDIKGKKYVPVAYRVLYFNETYPNGMIQTEITHDLELVRCVAKVTPDVTTPERFFTGHSEESRESTGVNQTSAVENAETSAIGRALGLMGIGVIDGIASADEVVKAQNKERVNELRGDNALPRKTCVSCAEEFNPKPGTERFAKQCPKCYRNQIPIPVAIVPPEPDLDKPPF